MPYYVQTQLTDKNSNLSIQNSKNIIFFFFLIRKIRKLDEINYPHWMLYTKIWLFESQNAKIILIFLILTKLINGQTN